MRFTAACDMREVPDMSRWAATLLLLLLGTAGCSAGTGPDKAGICAGGQAPPCHEAPDHSNGTPGGAQGGGQGNGGSMGHGGGMM